MAYKHGDMLRLDDAARVFTSFARHRLRVALGACRRDDRRCARGMLFGAAGISLLVARSSVFRSAFVVYQVYGRASST
jgi:hypothetical protein